MAFFISNKTLEKYFGFLIRLDKRSKKILIKKLSDSMDEIEKPNSQIASLYGAWKDDRTSDEIIEDIRNSRIDKSDNLAFE